MWRPGGGISRMSAGLSHPCPAGARAGTEGGAGIGSRKGRGPTQWGGPAESSVPVRARQSAMPETDGRAGVHGKARFTHDMYLPKKG